jgi:hypothetical protein
MQNRIDFDFIKNNIISTSPDSPTNSRYPNQYKLSNLSILIREPITKHVCVMDIGGINPVAKKIILQIILA